VLNTFVIVGTVVPVTSNSAGVLAELITVPFDGTVTESPVLRVMSPPAGTLLVTPPAVTVPP